MAGSGMGGGQDGEEQDGGGKTGKGAELRKGNWRFITLAIEDFICRINRFKLFLSQAGSKLFCEIV